MAIAYGGLLTGGNTGSSSSSYSTASVTPVAGNVTVFCGYTKVNALVPVASGCNLTWTLSYNDVGRGFYMFYGIGNSPSAGAITISNLTSGGANSGSLWSVFHFSGVDTTTPFAQRVIANGNSNAPAVTLGAFSTTRNNWAFSLTCLTLQTRTFTAGTNFTTISQTNRTSFALHTQYESIEGTSVTASMSGTSIWFMNAWEINEAVSTASTGDFFLMF
jgi:hypothetical protein